MKIKTGVILAVLALLLTGAAAYLYVSNNDGELPVGFVQGNGRLEAEQVEISTQKTNNKNLSGLTSAISAWRLVQSFGQLKNSWHAVPTQMSHQHLVRFGLFGTVNAAH